MPFTDLEGGIDYTSYNSKKIVEQADRLTVVVSKDDNNDADKTRAIDSIVGAPHEMTVPLDKLTEAPKEWDVFPTVSEEDVVRICASIQKYGLLHPITVWEQDDGSYMILGGNTRTACFKYLLAEKKDRRYAAIRARVYGKGLDEVDAHRIFLVSNTDQRQMSVSVQTRAFGELFKLEKNKKLYGSGLITREAAAKQAGVAKTVFGEVLRLQKLFGPLLKLIDDKKISRRIGYHLSFLPIGVQQAIYDRSLFLSRAFTIQAAKDMHAKNCQNIDEVNVILGTIKETDKIVITVPAGRKDEFRDKLIQAIKSSGYDQQLKNDLLQALAV